jgi:transposase-like protein
MAAQAVNPALEKHYSVAEIADLWGVSRNTVTRLFEGDPDVLVFGSEETRYGRKKITLRIPESAMIRVHNARVNKAR